jgi:hypothetical protein
MLAKASYLPGPGTLAKLKGTTHNVNNQACLEDLFLASVYT